VWQTPESVSKLVGEGFSVVVESGAGAAANFNDDTYRKAGATIGDRNGEREGMMRGGRERLVRLVTMTWPLMVTCLIM
jgi:NAD/NADP transhydrogenase alpha subunit